MDSKKFQKKIDRIVKEIERVGETAAAEKQPDAKKILSEVSDSMNEMARELAGAFIAGCDVSERILQQQRAGDALHEQGFRDIQARFQRASAAPDGKSRLQELQKALEKFTVDHEKQREKIEAAFAEAEKLARVMEALAGFAFIAVTINDSHYDTEALKTATEGLADSVTDIVPGVGFVKGVYDRIGEMRSIIKARKRDMDAFSSQAKRLRALQKAADAAADVCRHTRKDIEAKIPPK